eukprot:3626019-Pyramimonas_sp.AAC.1
MGTMHSSTCGLNPTAAAFGQTAVHLKWALYSATPIVNPAQHVQSQLSLFVPIVLVPISAP